MPGPTVAYVGLGANLGQAEATVRAAIQALDTLPGTRLLRASALFRSRAWGREDQPDFVNAAAALATALSAPALLDQLLALEGRFGRVRLPGERWGPRTLDLDLLLYGEEVVELPGLSVPHPHLHERAFALAPLAQIGAGAVIPGHGTVQAALARIGMSGLAPIG